MPYRLSKQADATECIRAVAVEQVDKALSELSDPDLDRHEVVHQARKRCKKLRGLARLVRPVFNDYQRENSAFRDAARRLARMREAQARIDCHDRLICHYSDQLQVEALSCVRERLACQRNAALGTDCNDGSLRRFLDDMHEARRRIPDWTIAADGFEAFCGGLRKTYRRARKAVHGLGDDPGPQAVHEWRKRVKYHWYHSRLLLPVWPDVLKTRNTALHRLSDLLGEDHDLWDLRQTLEAEPAEGADSDAVGVVVGLIERRSAELRAQALPLGMRLFAAKPKCLVSCYDTYWQQWCG